MELQRRHEGMDEVSPEVGELDEAALAGGVAPVVEDVVTEVAGRFTFRFQFSAFIQVVASANQGDCD